MPSIELMLDPESDAAIRAEWAALAEAGLPSQADHRSASNAPHITAAFAKLEWEPHVIAPPEFDVIIGSLIVFRRKRGVVLARQVIATEKLLAWQTEACGQLDDSLDIDPHSRLGAWTPHVTLARSMPLDALPAAIEALDPITDIPARLAGVRMWEGRTQTLTDLTTLAPVEF